MSRQYEFVDLPDEAYPLTMIAFSASGEEVWRAEVDGPAAIYVPPLAEKYGRVSIRIEWGDGQVTE